MMWSWGVTKACFEEYSKIYTFLAKKKALKLLLAGLSLNRN
jgi:hypothetical protein